MNFKNLNLDEIVRSATGMALEEMLSPLLEDEKKKQKAMENDLSELESDDDEKDDLDEADEEESEKSEDETEDALKTKVATGKDPKDEEDKQAIIPDSQELANVKPEQIISLLNMMRSGKSTKDADVQKSLKDYFSGMDPGERQALFIMMSGLSQILAGGVEGGEAPDPSTVGIKIVPKRATQDMSRKEKQAAADSAKSNKGEKPRPGDEEKPIKIGGGDSDSLPIKVGEVADKRGIRRKLRLLI